MPNINDLAERTGLSTATISRYLNGKPYVSKEAQLAIEIAVRELQYVPNAAARSLRSGRTGRVAFVVSDASHPFYSSLLAGVGKTAAEHGYDVLVQQVDRGEWNPDRLVQQVVTRAVDGVSVAVDLHPWDAYSKALSSLPVVTCDQALSETDFPAVYIEHRQATRDGLAHLYGQGARRIVCVGVGEARVCSSNVLRVGAYREFAAEHPDVSLSLYDAKDDLVVEGYELFRSVWSAGERPDAVFTGSDDVAAGLLLAAREAGVSVPNELRILGFDDQPIAKVLGISTIRQPVGRMGERAFELLMAHIEGREGEEPHKIRVTYRLIQRNTT